MTVTCAFVPPWACWQAVDLEVQGSALLTPGRGLHGVLAKLKGSPASLPRRRMPDCVAGFTTGLDVAVSGSAVLLISFPLAAGTSQPGEEARALLSTGPRLLWGQSPSEFAW